MKQHGDTVAGKKIEIIRKDIGGPAPDVAKRLAQELVVRDNVDMLAGWVLTPNALAAADVSAQAKKFMVVMNAATSIIITKSPYMIRTSVTLPQVMETFGTWAAKSGRQEVLHHGDRLRARDTTPRRRSSARSRRPAARSSDRCASRWPTRISRPSCSAPRTSTRNASSSSFPAARSRPRSARRSPSAASIRTRPRSWARARPPPSRRSRAWATPASASSRRGITTTRASDPRNVEFVKALQRDARAQSRLLLDRRL